MALFISDFLLVTLDVISDRFRDIVSFPLKTHNFSTPPFSLEFENVHLTLDR